MMRSNNNDRSFLQLLLFFSMSTMYCFSHRIIHILQLNVKLFEQQVLREFISLLSNSSRSADGNEVDDEEVDKLLVATNIITNTIILSHTTYMRGQLHAPCKFYALQSHFGSVTR